MRSNRKPLKTVKAAMKATPIWCHRAIIWVMDERHTGERKETGIRIVQLRDARNCALGLDSDLVTRPHLAGCRKTMLACLEL